MTVHYVIGDLSGSYLLQPNSDLKQFDISWGGMGSSSPELHRTGGPTDGLRTPSHAGLPDAWSLSQTSAEDPAGAAAHAELFNRFSAAPFLAAPSASLAHALPRPASPAPAHRAGEAQAQAQAQAQGHGFFAPAAPLRAPRDGPPKRLPLPAGQWAVAPVGAAQGPLGSRSPAVGGGSHEGGVGAPGSMSAGVHMGSRGVEEGEHGYPWWLGLSEVQFSNAAQRSVPTAEEAAEELAGGETSEGRNA